MHVAGIIFANDGTVSALTEKRTMASLPFGGRYRQVDFALSNLSCAGIHRIGIVTRHSYKSLMNHIGSGEEWGLTMEQGGLEYLTPYSSSRISDYRGKLESLYSAMSFLHDGKEEEWIVMIDSAILSNLDLRKIIASHIQSGKDITIVTKKGVADGEKTLDLAVLLDSRGEIADIGVDYAAPAAYEASMDIFVLSKKWLIGQVKEHIARNLFHMDRDLVLGLWRSGQATIHIYSYDGIAMYNESLQQYFQNSLSLIDAKVRADLFGRSHPVYTKVRDRVPAYYAHGCTIENCAVADGCMLAGHAKNSILFRQVTLQPNATVENAVVMPGTVIGAGAELNYVILDKHVTVRPGVRLVGAPSCPIVVKKGEVV